jgi:hypothetical protein
MLKCKIKKIKYKNIENITVCTKISLCCVRLDKCSLFLHRSIRTERNSDFDQHHTNVNALAKNLGENNVGG